MQLSAATLSDLKAHVNGNAAAAFAAGAVPGPAPTAGNEFCSIWKTAKPWMPFIISVASAIPVVGAAVAAGLNGLVAIANQICSST